MSGIRFIEAQGELLEAAINAPSARRFIPRLGARLGPGVRTHKRLAVVVVALVVAGCAAAVTSALSSSERLVLGGVNCYYGTGLTIPGNGHSSGLDTGARLVGGETPAAWCRHELLSYPPSELRQFGITPVHHLRLVTCEQSASAIAVLIASGRADQCRQLGLKPLPSSYGAAAASVHSLARALRALYFRRDCWAPSAFAAAIRATLRQHGYRGWSVAPPASRPAANRSPIGQGQCAQFIDPNPFSGNPYPSLDSHYRTLNLELGVPRTQNALMTRIDNTLSGAMWKRCYSPSSVRELVDRVLRGSGETAKIAITVNPNGGPDFSFGSTAHNRHYARGCVLTFFAWPSLDDRVAYVWLIRRHGAPLKSGQDPPVTDFHG